MVYLIQAKYFLQSEFELKIINDHRIINTNYPHNKNEFSKVVKKLYKDNQKMIILGGATKAKYGNPIDSPSHTVFTSELNKVIILYF